MIAPVTRLGLAIAVLIAGAPAFAAERGYTVTDFDRIELVGPFVVTVETGKAPSVRATGAATAIDRLRIDQRGRMLRISVNAGGWGGWPGERPPVPTIRVTVPGLRDASVNGGGKLAITKMRAQLVRLSVSGSGELSVSGLETDRLSATMLGSGSFVLGGKAQTGRVTNEGSGSIKGDALIVGNVDLVSNSAGPSTVGSNKTAKVHSTGSGTVTILGKPACSVTAVGSGEVVCGP